MPTPAAKGPEYHQDERESCGGQNGFDNFITCGRRSNGHGDAPALRFKRGSSSMPPGREISFNNASSGSDAEATLLSRMTKLENTFNQQLLVQRNVNSKHQVIQDTLERVEEMLKVAQQPAVRAPGRVSDNYAESKDRTTSAAVNELKAELKASGSGTLEALQALTAGWGSHFKEIELGMNSIRNEVARMGQQIGGVEQSVLTQNTSITMSTQTITDELRKMEDAAAEAAAAKFIANMPPLDVNSRGQALLSARQLSARGSQADRLSARGAAQVQAQVNPAEPKREPEKASGRPVVPPLPSLSELHPEAGKPLAVQAAPAEESAQLAPEEEDEPPDESEPVPRQLSSSQMDKPKKVPRRSTTKKDDTLISEDILSRIAVSTPFSMAASVMILLNMLYIGADVSMKVSHNLDLLRGVQAPVTTEWPETQKTIMVALEWTFAVWMSIEAIVNTTHCVRNGWASWKWNLFDLTLLATTWMDVVQSSVNLSFLRSMKLYRLIRLMRVGKILRALKAFRFLGGVRKMILSVAGSLTSLFWAFLLMSVIMYVVSLVMLQGIEGFLSDQVEQEREAFLAVRRLAPQRMLESPSMEGEEVGTAADGGRGGTPASAHGRRLISYYLEDDDTLYDALHKWYGGILSTMLTLFRTISGGAEWAEVAQPVSDLPGGMMYTLVWVMFMAFMIFGVLNVLTGVFCDAAMKAANEDKDMVIQELMDETEHHVKALGDIFNTCDEDGSGSIDQGEFEQMVDTPEVRNTLLRLGIEAEQAKDLFSLLDDDESGTIGIGEFVSGCLRMKGGAKSVDIVTLIFTTSKMMKRLDKTTHMVHEVSNHVRLMQGLAAQDYQSHWLTAAVHDGEAPPVQTIKDTKHPLSAQGYHQMYDGKLAKPKAHAKKK